MNDLASKEVPAELEVRAVDNVELEVRAAELGVLVVVRL